MKLLMKMCLFLCFNYIVMENSFKLFKILAINDRQRDILHVLQLANDTLIFLNGVTNQATLDMDVLVNTRCEQTFIFILNVHEIIYYDKGVVDLKKYSIQTTPVNEANLKNNIDIFYNWGTFLSWSEKKTSSHPLLRRSVIGYTFENHEIYLFEIIKHKTRPAVYIVGGEEGRDWIPPAVIISVINSLLDVSSPYHGLLNILSFYFVPILNPDGYIYSMTQERLWAKNRDIKTIKLCTTMNSEDGIDIAVGVNVDRNWYFSKSAYIYNGECNSIHFGHTPISEDETISLSFSLNKVAPKLLAYINVKGFLRLIAVPYATSNYFSDNHFLKMEIIKAACKEIYDKYKHGYQYGSTEKYFFNGIGNSADWVKKNLNIPMVYTVYLKNEEEFLPQPTDIFPLTQVLLTILNKTLIMSYKIYKPLYDQ